MKKPRFTLVAVMLFLFSAIYFMTGYGTYTGWETTGVEGITIHMEQPSPGIGTILMVIGLIHLAVGIIDYVFQISYRKEPRS